MTDSATLILKLLQIGIPLKMVDFNLQGNSNMCTGPKRDIVKELKQSIIKQGLHFGVYISLYGNHCFGNSMLICKRMVQLSVQFRQEKLS